MDHVYDVYSSKASEKVNIKEYFDNYLKHIGDVRTCIPLQKAESNVLPLMGLEMDEGELSLLATYCSPDNLTVEGEVPKLLNTTKMRKKSIFDPEEPPDVDLKTIKFLRDRLKQKSKMLNYKYLSESKINYEKVGKTDGKVMVPGEEIIVTVRTYHPFTQQGRDAFKKECGTLLRLDKVINVLGSQTLADLRDKISCIADYSISVECSDNLDNAIGPMAKDVYKSGFIYVEGTFYNDMRHPENIDYSEVIINWARRRPKLGPFKTALMENTRLDSLCLRFGFPWVYKHQGGCEHLIVFCNARLMNCDDELAASEYPRIIRMRHVSSKYCMICGLYSAKWITMQNERLPHNPCYFCDKCFKSYNYIDGKKVGKFEAYAYPRNTAAVKGIIDV